MTAVWQALIVLAWMVLLLLVFAYAALLRDVRELQAGVRTGDLAASGKVTAPALATSNEEGTYALAVDPACASCRIAVGAFAQPAAGPDRRIVTAVDEVTDWPEAAAVGVVVDRALWDSLHIQTTPMLLRFDPAGVLRERQIVGSAKHLEKLLGGAS
ncbi:hypothetical protein [Allorhizocola rhizosphaerae]|uniref:hypothetical protein n=1 Tax=Allorhizocola rhizosphaerae TaxID=1872709 RepID=UPI000E3DB2B6|nr:hypothetical protein [Allorhizocola rhizosphaerae]